MAFDAGGKRIGIAVTDPLQIIAQSLETVDAGTIIPYLKNYLQKETVETFVVGDPKNLDGGQSQGTPIAEKLVADLQKAFPDIPIVRIDERFTSQIAMRSLVESGMKKSQRRQKGEVDKVSAALILQTYLDKKNFR